LTGTAVPAALSNSDMAENILDRLEQKAIQLIPGIEKHIT
jgi:hypothetical protein